MYEAWLKGMSERYQNEWHGFGEDQMDFSGTWWALALIDGHADHRARYINALLGNCQYVVVHDTEPESRINYLGMEEALAAWPNRRDFTWLAPHTTVVWG